MTIKGRYFDVVGGPDARAAAAITEGEGRLEKTYLTREEVRWHAFAIFGLVVVALTAIVWVLSGVKFSVVPTDDGSTCRPLASEFRLVALALSSAVVGGLIHAASSLASFAGNRELVRSWLPWFYLRPLVAALLGVAVYLGARSGVFGLESIDECSDVYTLGFITLLAGMFSKKVTDKLADLVDVLFPSAQALGRRDKLSGTRDPEATAVRVPNEALDRVHALLVTLGYLSDYPDPVAEGGVPEATRGAIDRFLEEHGISGTDRRDAVGQSHEAEYWPRLIELLEQAASEG